MSHLPSWYTRLPTVLSRGGADLAKFFSSIQDDFNSIISNPSGLAVYSNDKHVFVDCDVPGLTAKEVRVEIDHDNVLWIKGERKVEERGKKYMRKALETFAYCVPLWEEIDTHKQPTATCKNGIMHITFDKKKVKNGKKASKQIRAKEEK